MEKLTFDKKFEFLDYAPALPVAKSGMVMGISFDGTDFELTDPDVISIPNPNKTTYQIIEETIKKLS